jgi:hypothetical protein
MSQVQEVETASARLRAKLEPLVAEVSARSQMMVEHPHPRAVYRALVELLYSEVRASVPLMLAARHKAVELAAHGDPVAQGLLPWLEEHTVEETDHDRWLLDDYARIGGDPNRIVCRPGSPTVAAMVGSVYYWTLHAHPVALLGYCALLEGTPPSSRFIEELVQRTGYPSEAFDTLRHHSDIDVDHGGELFELMDSLPLSAEHEAIIGMTALQAADLLITAGDELLDSLGADA